MNTQEKMEYEDYMKGLVVSKSMIETAKLEGELIGEARGEAKGEARGEAKGKEEERTLANRDFTISLITNTDFDDAKIATLVGVDIAWVAEIRKGLGEIRYRQ